MDLKLKGKKAVVLASSSGIGQGVANVLSLEGCDVAICGRDDVKLKKIAKDLEKNANGEIIAFPTDIANAASLDNFFNEVKNRFGKIDILINNAGGPPPGEVSEFDDDYYYNSYNLILMSVVRSCRHVIPGMVENKWGRIINIESTTMKCAAKNMVLSNTFRAAVGAFSKTLSLENARNGIRVHTIMTGSFMTPRVKELGIFAADKQNISFEEWKENAQEGTILGRFGDPIEMGNLIAFLSSDVADYLNGTCIPIDGGNIASTF